MRDGSTYRAARRNAIRAKGQMALWREGRMASDRQDGFTFGWHRSMEPSPMGSGVPKIGTAVLTDLAQAAE